MLLAPDTPNTVIWKRIKEEPVDQKEIESLYALAQTEAASNPDEEVVKVKTLTKRTFFTAEENQKLCIGLS